jgi:hypothetical protein
MENFGQDRRSTGRDLNTRPTGYEAGVSANRPQSSVWSMVLLEKLIVANVVK